MNINDYKKAVQRIEIRPELKENVIETSTRRSVKHSFSKKRVIPVLAAAVVGCVCITAAFADELRGIFVKTTKFEMSISSVAEPQKREVQVLNAVPKKWNEDVINQLFMEGKTVVESDEYPSDTNPDIRRKWFDFDDNSTVCFEDGEISWRIKSDYDYEHISSIVLNSMGAGKNPFTKSEIDGLDKQESLAKADALIDALEIPVSSYEIIALDCETLIKEDDVRNENGERIYKHGEVLPEWTEEQEAYLIVYQADGGDLPITSQRYASQKFCTEGSEIYAVVSRRGVECFQARWVFDTSESVNSKAEVCTAEEAAYALYAKYDREIPLSDTTVNNCKLVYLLVPVEYGKTYEMRPYWEFYSTVECRYYTPEFVQDGFDYHQTFFVNAETCEVLE